MKKMLLKYKKFYIPLVVLVFFLLDQISKEIILRTLKVGESVPEEGFFRFTHVRNFGSAFSIIQDANLFLMIVGILAIILIIYFLIFVAKDSVALQLSISLQLSGAFGNIMDRIRLGSVTDFIDVGSWPVFNIADSCISVGMAMLAFYLYINWKEERKANEKNNL
ncbi:MAG: signal peptidase II [Chloroflexi bacterium]|nr:signal peptidase II [Chloroflexota bacterium]|tara:strand:- start:1376 stop:1870 length:495 start_codon:yes stop_codon:yes gene_type:complete